MITLIIPVDRIAKSLVEERDALVNVHLSLAAIEGDSTPSAGNDMFRIKIWGKSTNNMIVNDSALGMADDSKLTTIYGGSVSISAKFLQSPP